MSLGELIEGLRGLSIPERLVLIEAATDLIRRDLSSESSSDVPSSGADEDPILGVIGCLDGDPLSSREIDEELYGAIRS